MPASESVETGDRGINSFCVELRFKAQRWLFDLDEASDRAIVVGSAMYADVRLDITAVAPVHFHLERQDDAIWIVPAYGVDIRVNAARIARSCCVPVRATIDFAGIQVEVAVLAEAPPESPAASVTVRRDWLKHPEEYLASVPSEFQTTRTLELAPIAFESMETRECRTLPHLGDPERNADLAAMVESRDPIDEERTEVMSSIRVLAEPDLQEVAERTAALLPPHPDFSTGVREPGVPSESKTVALDAARSMKPRSPGASPATAMQFSPFETQRWQSPRFDAEVSAHEGRRDSRGASRNRLDARNGSKVSGMPRRSGPLTPAAGTEATANISASSKVENGRALADKPATAAVTSAQDTVACDRSTPPGLAISLMSNQPADDAVRKQNRCRRLSWRPGASRGSGPLETLVRLAVVTRSHSRMIAFAVLCTAAVLVVAFVGSNTVLLEARMHGPAERELAGSRQEISLSTEPPEERRAVRADAELIARAAPAAAILPHSTDGSSPTPIVAPFEITLGAAERRPPRADVRKTPDSRSSRSQNRSLHQRRLRSAKRTMCAAGP
jgi:hypothetical protein